MAINENDSRVRRTKLMIRRGLTQLAKEKSINKITVKELTDLIGINRGTFYLHYKDVSDLVEAIENDLYNEFNEIIASVNPQSIIADPVGVFEHLCTFISENADVCGMLLSEHGDAEFVYKFGTLMNEKCLNVFTAVNPNMNMEIYNLTYQYCKYGSAGLIRCWLIENPHWTPRETAELLFKLISTGVYSIVDERARRVF
ncbi:MAG: TetR/AcrR family transcriptional regulator [Oscillospiraceae bacterium]|nr:TetR/AcrR family transcriptional regulator [Oscillospiraceae bacterium]